jgi:CHAT domain-containing protein
MVFAQERGTDVTLALTDAAGHELARADSPIRRTGVQRVELETRSDQQYFIVVTGKEHSTGSVDIRVIDSKGAADSACLRAQRVLAVADRAYAAGQTVSRAVLKKGGVSSDEAYAQAAREYRTAIATLQADGASDLLAQAQHAESAVMYQDIKNWQESKAWAAEGVHTYHELHDAYGAARAQALEAAALVEIAVSVESDAAATGATRSDGQQRAPQMLEQARVVFTSLAQFHARRAESHDQALALNNIGYAYYFEGRYDEAIRAYQQSLPIYRHTRDRPRQAQVLQNIALVEYELGRLSAAIPHFEQALELINRDEDPQLRAVVLSNNALARWASGYEDVALRLYGDALTLAQTTQDTAEQAVALHGIASVYNNLGDQARASYFYKQALALRSAALDARGRTASLRAIANVSRQQGHAEEALKLDQEALSLASAPTIRQRIAVQIAKDLADLGRTAEAREQLESVLSQRAPGDDVEHARALQERARYRVAANDLAGAKADLKSAVATFRTYESTTDEFTAWIALAQLLRHQGESQDAFAAVDRALALAEEVRMQSANPELRSTLLQPLRPAFDLKISMLAQLYAAAQNDPAAQARIASRALATAEQARARALADFQNIDVTAPGLDSRLLERRRTIYRELAARRFRLETLLDRSGTDDSESHAIRADIAALRQDLDQIDAQIGAASQTAKAPGAAHALGQQTAVDPALIPPDVAVVEYWLGSEAAFAWVVTRGGVTMTRLGSTSTINSQAMALHTAMRAYGSVSKADRLKAGETLYAAVLGPLEAQVSLSRTLIFAPDGALHYVPFATLRSGAPGRKQFLVENHDIAVTPSIEMLLGREKARPVIAEAKEMLLVADPVYGANDPRVAQAAGAPGATGAQTATAQLIPAADLVRGQADSAHLERLPGATREAAAIAALLPEGAVERLDGLSANRETFLAAPLEHFRFIHVASHANTDAEIPQASALILSTVDQQGSDIDGRVLAADFMSFRLRADVVVLSGCDTALGRSIAGEGLIGLHYIVLARGARSVVSSLWPALDQVTAELMVPFYSTLLNQHTSVISAWSAASRATLSGRYADPGTWGAFMLTLSHIDDVKSR